MTVDVARDQVRVRCGCRRIFPGLRQMWGHHGKHVSPECKGEYTFVLSDAIVPPAQQLPSSSTEIAGAAPAPPGGGDEGKTDDSAPSSSGGRAVQDPPLERGPQQTEGYGLPQPSTAPEARLAFPVSARFTYDAYRMQYPGYNEPFGKFLFDMMELAKWALGLWPAAIWTKPFSPPPPEYLQPIYTPEGFDELVEEMQSAATA